MLRTPHPLFPGRSQRPGGRPASVPPASVPDIPPSRCSIVPVSGDTPERPGNPTPRHARGPRGDAGCRTLVDDVTEMTGSDCVDITVDRKSTRLNSSHANISYAVFCLKKKKDM